MTRSSLYPPVVFTLQFALGFTIAWLLTEGALAQSIIVIVFLGLSFAYLLRDERRPILFDLVFALAALLAAIGYTSGFMESVVYYDKVTHTFMTFSVSLAFFFLFYAGSVPRRRAISLATSVFTLGFTVGALWEVFEWSTGVGEGGLSDTITDLIVDGVGALAAALVALAVRERGERLTQGELLGQPPRHIYLPPYSPDYYPIEEAFSKIKGLLREAAVRTRESLVRAIGRAPSAVTARDAWGFFERCGYRSSGQLL